MVPRTSRRRSSCFGTQHVFRMAPSNSARAGDGVAAPALYSNQSHGLCLCLYLGTRLSVDLGLGLIAWARPQLMQKNAREP